MGEGAVKDELAPLYLGSLFNRNGKQVLEQVPEQPFSISKYPRSFNLLNFHSLRPAYDNPEYSLTLYGQNVLNTFQSELSYTYNENEASHKLGYNGIFGGTYIQPVFGVNQTWNRSAVYAADTVLHWNEFTAYAGLQLPLNLSGGKQYRYLTLSSTFNADMIRWTGIAEKLLRNQDFNYLSNRIVYTVRSRKRYSKFTRTGRRACCCNTGTASIIIRPTSYWQADHCTCLVSAPTIV